MLHPISPANRLKAVRYDIRGALNARAIDLEQQGRRVVKLNIGNPALFGFSVPDVLHEAMRCHTQASEAYGHQQGLLDAREAIIEREIKRGATHAHPSQVFIGNGVSELIDIALRALLEPGDEVLIPSPDYPLWTAAVHLNEGIPVHYPCPPERDGQPDLDALEQAITPRTRALVVINPNNPIGAVYPKTVLKRMAELAERHGLVVFSDEIYDGLTFDGARFEPMASLVRETLCVTMSGLSKVWRACGWRVGWMSLSGAVKPAREYIKALDLLAALRLCSNMMGQWTIRTALSLAGPAESLTAPGGRLFETRKALLDGVAKSRYLTVPSPDGAIYAFPGVDTGLIPDFDDQAFALQLLERKHILVVPGSSFNVRYCNHFRITLLPEAPLMRRVLLDFEDVLAEMAGNSKEAVA